MVLNPVNIDTIYPVGSIYMSMNGTSPATLFGGSWTRIENRFLLACSDTHSKGETGGSETVTLSQSQMPSHSHYEQLDFEGFGVRNVASSPGTGEGSGKVVSFDNTGSSEQEQYIQTQIAGGGQAHENMPPYIAVYMWYRTA